MKDLASALAGRYRIERELGAGGMATVYLAHDIKHDRKVAIKVLKPELAAVLGAERFIVEIKTTAALQHPHILPLFDSGEADGFLYYVMPYIQGETIREKLNRETQCGVDEAVRIAREVADALDYAHRHGVIHRDIKPENILLHDGRAMVMDFGIALAVSAAAGGRMTETGLSLGTPHYMSPEQATAEKAISGRSDVYSLATVLYEMLAGNPPHVGASAQQIIMKIITEPAEPVTKYRKSVPLNVAAALEKALDKLPADRFDSAKTFADALGNLAYAGEVRTDAVRSPHTRRTRRMAVVAVAALILAGGLAVWTWPRSPATTDVSYRVIVSQAARTGSIWLSLVLSPDGETILFSQATDSSRQIWIKRPARPDAELLAGAGGGDAPALSPDGQWVAFVADGRLRKVSIGGGNAVPLSDVAAARRAVTAWRDDGTILFTGRDGDLMSIGDDGGVARLVVSHDSLVDQIVSMASVPRTQVALLVTCATNCTRRKIRAVDLTTGRMNPLPATGTHVWWLDGGRVAIAERGRISVVPFDANTLAFSGPLVSKLEDVTVEAIPNTMAALARNGTLLYVPQATQQREPVWVSRTGEITRADSGRRYEPSGIGQLTLSPDGTRLLLNVGRPSSEMYIHDLVARTLVRQSFGTRAMAAAWDDGGRSFLYYTFDKGRYHLFRRSDGSTASEPLLTADRDFHSISVLRDTNELLVRLGAPPTRDIYRAVRGVDRSMRLTPLLASDSYQEVSPTLSPDERWIAYSSDETGRFEVFVRPFPDVDAGKWQLSQSGGGSPRWSHSGRELFYLSGGAMMAVPVGAGPPFVSGIPQTLFTIPEGAVWSPVEHVYDVAPDDRRFIMMRRVHADDEMPANAAVLIPRWLGAK